MNFYIFYNAIIIPIAVFLGIIVYSGKHTNGPNKVFLFLMWITAYNALCRIFQFTSSDASTAFVWFKAAFLWPFLMAGLLLFVIIQMDPEKRANKNFVVALFIPAVTVSFMHLFTSPSEIVLMPQPYRWAFRLGAGITAYMSIVYFYIYFFAVVFLIVSFLRKHRKAFSLPETLSSNTGIIFTSFSCVFLYGVPFYIDYKFKLIGWLLFIIGSILFTLGRQKNHFFSVNYLSVAEEIISTINDYSVITDATGKILAASKSFLICTGYKVNEVYGERMEKYFAERISMHGLSVPSIPLLNVEAYVITKWNEKIPVSIVTSFIIAPGTNKKLMLLVGRDLRKEELFKEELISAQRSIEENANERIEELTQGNLDLKSEIGIRLNVERTLRESEAKYKGIFKFAPIGIFTSKFDGEIVICNIVFAKILGYDYTQDMYQINMKDIYLDRNERTKLVEQYLHANISSSHELRWKKKDGSIIWVQLTVHGIRDESGEPRYFEGFITDISSKKETESKLRNSEKRYRNLVESINEIFYITNRKGKTVYVSPNVISYLGYPSDYLIGKSSFIMIHREDFRRVFNFYQSKLQEEAIDASIEFRVVKMDGSFSWVEQITRIVRDVNGDVAEFRSVIRDITDRKIAEEKVQLLVQAIHHTGEGISITDLEDNLLFVNDAFLNIFGYRRDELMGRNINIIRSEKNPAQLLEEVRTGTLNGGWEGELINRKKDGTRFPVFLSTSPILDGKGNAYALVGVTRDITERKLAEEQLEEYKNHLEQLVAVRTQELDKANKLLQKEINKLKIAEEKIQDQVSFLQTIIDTIPNPIFIRDKNKLFYGCNKAYENFVGMKREDLIGKSIFQIPSIQENKFINEKDSELLANPGKQVYQLTSNVLDGTRADLLFYKATFNNRDGSVGGIVGIVVDVSELKKMERDTIEALQKEKELNQLKSRFISVASHEFRTPLTSILASADLLELYGRSWPDSKYYQYVGNIQKAVEYMTELINDVLTINRGEQGQIKLNPEKLNLGELLEEILGNIKIAAVQNIVFKLEYELEENIFSLDKKLITQIMTNLISNSVKYSPNGGKVIVSAVKENDFLLLSVADEGIGISEEDLSHMAEPFHRGKNVGAIAGTGLGFSITQKSVEIHGGNLSIQSKLNVGTKITVTFDYEKIRAPRTHFASEAV